MTMKPVDQTIVDRYHGDCMRAVIASLLELRIEAVPHLMYLPDDKWFQVMCNFFWALGYNFFGNGFPRILTKLKMR